MADKRLIYKLDVLFAKQIKSLGYCVKCLNRNSLDCCHIIPRDYMITRWDKDNALCMCRHCHSEGHRFPKEFKQWVECHLGSEKYSKLMAKKNIIKKWTDEELISMCNQYTSK